MTKEYTAKEPALAPPVYPGELLREDVLSAAGLSYPRPHAPCAFLGKHCMASWPGVSRSHPRWHCG